MNSENFSGLLLCIFGVILVLSVSAAVVGVRNSDNDAMAKMVAAGVPALDAACAVGEIRPCDVIGRKR